MSNRHQTVKSIVVDRDRVCQFFDAIGGRPYCTAIVGVLTVPKDKDKTPEKPTESDYRIVTKFRELLTIEGKNHLGERVLSEIEKCQVMWHLCPDFKKGVAAPEWQPKPLPQTENVEVALSGQLETEARM
jgi:hypothetical protein